jgi:hypothetical protein
MRAIEVEDRHHHESVNRWTWTTTTAKSRKAEEVHGPGHEPRPMDVWLKIPLRPRRDQEIIG